MASWTKPSAMSNPEQAKQASGSNHEGWTGKIAGAAVGAVGAGGALALMGQSPKEIGDLVQSAGVPFSVLLLVFWLLKPIAQKHVEFMERTAQSNENLAKSYDKLVDTVDHHTEILTELVDKIAPEEE